MVALWAIETLWWLSKKSYSICVYMVYGNPKSELEKQLDELKQQLDALEKKLDETNVPTVPPLISESILRITVPEERQAIMDADRDAKS